MAHNIEDCKSVFVTWVKMFAMLAASVAVAVGGAWRCAMVEAGQNQTIRDNVREIQNVTRIVDVLQIRLVADMDTLKTELRKQGR